ncbi:hypothetical protein HDU98_002762 [Podochytrium sp. JEL0797]|nr:hypothetical protein HDU98_002762 [Podochytrium sp. JEL0797]
MMRSDANPQDLDLSTAAFTDLEGGLGAGMVSGLGYTYVDCSSVFGNAPSPAQTTAAVIEAPVPVPNALPMTAETTDAAPAPETTAVAETTAAVVQTTADSDSISSSASSTRNASASIASASGIAKAAPVQAATTMASTQTTSGAAASAFAVGSAAMALFALLLI